MKNLIFIIFILFFSLDTNVSFSQDCDSCGCATRPTYTQTNSSPFFGGKLKPKRSDINNSDPNSYFPILMVFVQFKNELGDSTTTNFDSWPARRPPNFIDSMIRLSKNSITNWWNAYNGYAISDYWHEFSRGKLHIRGQAVSVILPYDT